MTGNRQVAGPAGNVDKKRLYSFKKAESFLALTRRK